jgi:hypothetical protein
MMPENANRNYCHATPATKPSIPINATLETHVIGAEIEASVEDGVVHFRQYSFWIPTELQTTRREKCGVVESRHISDAGQLDKYRNLHP